VPGARLLLRVQFRSRDGSTNELARTALWFAYSALAVVPGTFGYEYQEIRGLRFQDVCPQN
jgi:hypothetical protein